MATLAFVSRLKSSGHIRPSLLLLSGSDAPSGGVSDGDSQFSEKVVAGGLVDPDSGIMLKNDGIVANDFEEIVKLASTDSVAHIVDVQLREKTLVQRRAIVLAMVGATSADNLALKAILNKGFLFTVKSWLDDILQTGTGGVDLLLHLLSNIALFPVTKEMITTSKLEEQVATVEEHEICIQGMNQSAIKERVASLKEEWNASVERMKKANRTSNGSKRSLEDHKQLHANKKSKANNQPAKKSLLSSNLQQVSFMQSSDSDRVPKKTEERAVTNNSLLNQSLESNNFYDDEDDNDHVKLNEGNFELLEAGTESLFAISQVEPVASDQPIENVEKVEKPSKAAIELKVNSRVMVWWQLEKKDFFGKLTKIDSKSDLPHHIQYDDDDSEWTNLNNRRFEIVGEAKKTSNLAEKLTVDTAVSVWWPLDQKEFSGIVIEIDMKRNVPHHIRYDDGDTEWTDLNYRKFEIVGEVKKTSNLAEMLNVDTAAVCHSLSKCRRSLRKNVPTVRYGFGGKHSLPTLHKHSKKKARRIIIDDSSDNDISSYSSGDDPDLFPASDSIASISAVGSPKNTSAGGGWLNSTTTSIEQQPPTTPAANSTRGGWGGGNAISAGGWSNSTTTTSVEQQPPTTPAANSTRGGWGRGQAISAGGWSKNTSTKAWRPVERGWEGTKPDNSNVLAIVSPCKSKPVSVFRSPASKSIGTLPNDLIEGDNEPLQIIEESADQFILRHFFGSSNVMIQKATNKTAPIRKMKCFNGAEFNLVATKLEKGSYNKFTSAPSGYVKAYYVKGTSKYVKTELEKLADFSELWDDPGKLASRIELLLTPACCITVGGKKMACTYLKNTSSFVVLSAKEYPENKTMGCGFIPKEMLEELLGGEGRIGQDAVAIQVRVVSSKLGIFKGMLVSKIGIKKIQLPLSMRKVPKSILRDKKNDSKTYLLINHICPSQNSLNLERSINPNINLKPTKSAENDLEGLSDQMQKVLLQCGASQDVIDSYNDNDAKTWRGRGHTSLYGVCDVTNGRLPQGSVFIPGLFAYDGAKRKVLITRSPCTEATDLASVPVVTSKPSSMTNQDWQHLCSLSLGVVMFGSPEQRHTKSLPELINNSDLDGDRFCVIWAEQILDNLAKNSLKPGRKAQLINSLTYNVGDVVEVKLNSESYYGAKISKVCGPDVKFEAYDIQFDGEKTIEKEVALYDIQKPKKRNTATTNHMKKVVNHKGSGKKLEVEIEMYGSQNEWRGFQEFKRLNEDLLADYAIQEKLLGSKDWKWANKHVRDAEIVLIKSLKYNTKEDRYEASVVYDGFLQPTCEDAMDIDIDLLSKYIKDHKGEQISWDWIDKRIAEAKNEWFSRLQETLANLGSLNDHHLLVTRLNSEYKNKAGNHCLDDVEAFGRAYKLANGIGKHGGRVSLPAHLRGVIVKQKVQLHDFIKDL